MPSSEGNDDGLAKNDSSRFDRVPATAAERTVAGRPSREAILDWWHDCYGIDPTVFAAYTFWEHGDGKIWILQGDVPSPADVEALGLMALRTRQEHWKPTLEAIQRFGGHASKNCLHLPESQARDFLAGEDQEIDWDGDWGYLVVTHDIAGDTEPIGVGLFTYGELKSMVPKGRRRDLS